MRMGSKINFLLLFFSNFHFDLLHKRNEGRNEKGKKSSQFQNMPSFLRPVWWFWCFQSLAPLYLTLTQSKWENVQFSWWKKTLLSSVWKHFALLNLAYWWCHSQTVSRSSGSEKENYCTRWKEVSKIWQAEMKKLSRERHFCMTFY